MCDGSVFSFNAEELKKYHPKRYSFLLIDRVTEVLPGKYANGYKNVSNNEWYIPVHFPGHPNMPGMPSGGSNGADAIVAILTTAGMEGRIVHGYKHAGTFHREVVPGDRHDLEAEILSFKRELCMGKVKGYVDGILTCELESTIIVPDIFNQFKPMRED